MLFYCQNLLNFQGAQALIQVRSLSKIVNNYDMKRFCVFRNNSERLRKSVENEIKVKFCMSTETVKNVVDKLVEKV